MHGVKHCNKPRQQARCQKLQKKLDFSLLLTNEDVITFFFSLLGVIKVKIELVEQKHYHSKFNKLTLIY